MLPRSFLLGCTLFYLIIVGAVMPMALNLPSSDVFVSDAASYNAGAIHLAREGLYSVDGVHAYMEREPGFSLFLSFIYRVFGEENRFGIYLTQALLYLVASILFVSQLTRLANRRAAAICLVLLVSFPAVFHTIFSVNRESFILSMWLLLSAMLLQIAHLPSWKLSVTSGVLLGWLILAYMPFLFFPFFLLPIFWLYRIPWKYIVPLFCIPFILVLGWSWRNELQNGEFRPVGDLRTTVMWYARADQAQYLRGLEPFYCLWSEYISRNWDGRSPYCSTVAIFHRKWPGGMALGNESEIAHESQARILRYFPYYLWFSVFEILELHIPFVDGTGYLYNRLAALGSAIIYAGIFVGFLGTFQRRYVFLWIVAFYTVAVFSLTDATPRYIMPTIFAYIALAALSYDWFISSISARLHALRSR